LFVIVRVSSSPDAAIDADAVALAALSPNRLTAVTL